jgi:hypothetical protein
VHRAGESDSFFPIFEFRREERVVEVGEDERGEAGAAAGEPVGSA